MVMAEFLLCAPLLVTFSTSTRILRASHLLLPTFPTRAFGAPPPRVAVPAAHHRRRRRRVPRVVGPQSSSRTRRGRRSTSFSRIRLRQSKDTQPGQSTTCIRGGVRDTLLMHRDDRDYRTAAVCIHHRQIYVNGNDAISEETDKIFLPNHLYFIGT